MALIITATHKKKQSRTAILRMDNVISKTKEGLYKKQPYAKGEAHAGRPTHFQASYYCLKVIRQMHQVMSTHYSRNKDKTSQLILGHCKSEVTTDWFTFSLLDS